MAVFLDRSDKKHIFQKISLVTILDKFRVASNTYIAIT